MEWILGTLIGLLLCKLADLKDRGYNGD